MSPDIAGALVRYIVATDIEQKSIQAGDGWLRRKFTGMNKAALQKKRIVLSRDQRGVVPASDGWPETFVFFWLLSSREDKETSIVLEQAKGAVLATVQAGVGAVAGSGVMGTTVMQLHNAYSFASDVTGNVPQTTGFGSGMMDQRARAMIGKMEAAVDNAAYNAVKGTENEWCIAIKSMMLCGVAAISGDPRHTTIFLRKCRDAQHLQTLMTTSYRYGLNSVDGRRYVRNCSDDEIWGYDATRGELLKA